MTYLPGGLPLAQLSWAGQQFPFSDPTNTDLVVAGNTTWSDAGGFRRYRSLTINAGIVLTIARFPFFIFVDTLVFGSVGSIIDASGPAGASAGTFAAGYARGATVVSGGGRAQGGCGGGLLVVCARTITTAAGQFKANGGAAYRNGTLATGYTAWGGQGALSSSFDRATTTGEALAPNVNLGDGGGQATVIGTSGGSGGGVAGSGHAGGGSGLGGGGGVAGAVGSVGATRTAAVTPGQLLDLALKGCLGGGGGGAYIDQSNAAQNAAGGGGGGGILVVCDVLAVTPTLAVTGGAGVSNTGTATGADGVAHLVEV